MKQKLQTAWAVFKQGAWVGVVSTVLTAGVTYGILDAGEKGVIINALTGAVNAANLIATAIHSIKTHKTVVNTPPTATLIGPA